jgi:O-antigen/teichoic acid export membrane protein
MRGVFKEISYITISSFLGQFISLFVVFYVAKALGPFGFGELSYLMSITILFPVISGFGVPNAIFRFYNTIDDEDEKEKKIVLTTGFLFVLFSSLLLCTITYFILGSIEFDLISSYRFLFCVYGFIISLTYILNTIIRSKRDYKKISIISISHPLIKAIIILVIIFFSTLSVSSLLIANILSEFIILLYILVNIDEKINLNYFSFNRLKKIIKYGISFLPHRMVTKGQDPLIKSFILSFFGSDYVGIYAMAQKINLPFSFLIDRIQFIWGPLKFDIKKNVKKPKYHFQNITQSYISLISLVTITYIFSLLVLESYDVFKTYPGVEFLSAILTIVAFLKSNYYMYASGAEFGKNMYVLPLSDIGYFIIIFILYKYSPFFQHNIFHLMIPIIFAELYSIVLMRNYSNSKFYFKINFITGFTTFSFALICVLFCLNQYLTLFIPLFLVSSVSILINRNSIKLTKNLLGNKL